MKNIAILIAFLLSMAGCYSLGYLHAANDAVSLLSVSQAQTSLATLGLIERNDLDRAKGINTSLIEASLEALNEVEKSKREIWMFPLNFLELRKTFNGNKEVLDERKSKIQRHFKSYKDNVQKKSNLKMPKRGFPTFQ